MILFVTLSLLPVIACVVGDRALLHPRHYFIRSAIDSLTHGLTGVLSWLILVYKTPNYSRGCIHSMYFEMALAGVFATFVDLDHFIAARSFRLNDALSLGEERPFMHSSSLLSVVVLSLLAFGKVEFVQQEIYWFTGVLLVLVIILFILVITLFIKHSRLKNELTRKVKEVHKFNVPYIDPREDLARRGYAQYPERPIALQH